jgi:hypothetical protein
VGNGSQDVDLIEEINSYIWDEAVLQYELLTSGTKKYMWNRSLRVYEVCFRICNTVWGTTMFNPKKF